LRVAGFQDGAQLTLSQHNGTVMSTYVDQNGLTQSLRFSTRKDTLATIAQAGQAIPGFKSFCVLRPGGGAGYPATMTVTAGELAYEAGMVFLTVTGNLRSDAGACGTLSQPEASFWVVCEVRQGGAFPKVDVGRPAKAQMPAGRHSCRAQVETLNHSDGRNEYVAGGGNGTLTLTEHGAQLAAEYSGDKSVAGTLHFAATTSTTASAETGQILVAPCVGAGRLSGAAETLRIAAGSLTMLDATLFLSFAGTMADGSSCAGAQVAGSLICSK
jgi:hypothetical protein